MAEKEKARIDSSSINNSEKQKKLARLKELEENLKKMEAKEAKPEILIKKGESFDQNVPKPDPVTQLLHLSELPQKFAAIDYLNTEEIVKDLEEIISDCSKNNQIRAALLNCESLLAIALNKQNSKLIERYSPLWQNFMAIRKIKEQEKRKERIEIDKQLSIIRKYINIDPAVAACMEEIPIDQLLNQTANQIDNIQAIADEVLQQHRVQLSHEMKHSVIARTTSGKSFEQAGTSKIHFNLNPKALKPGGIPGQSGPIDYIVEHTVENPYTDPISDAIIEDIIPYNYKITEIVVNEELIDTLPETSLEKEGFQVTWKVPPLPPNTPIKFRYHLRPRVSRTIVVPLEQEVKIIKTHSSPDPTRFSINLSNPTNTKSEPRIYDPAQNISTSGIFETTLEFQNKFDQTLNGVLMEDRIPLFYQYMVQEIKNQEFKSIKETAQNAVKWKLFDMHVDSGSKYEYSLIEPYKVEELKIEAEKILSTDLSKLNPSERNLLRQKIQKAQEFLNKTQ